MPAASNGTSTSHMPTVTHCPSTYSPTTVSPDLTLATYTELGVTRRLGTHAVYLNVDRHELTMPENERLPFDGLICPGRAAARGAQWGSRPRWTPWWVPARTRNRCRSGP